MGVIPYATREMVLNSLEVAHTARAASIIDSKLLAGAESVEGMLHRRFYPERATRYFDWPNWSSAPAWTVWLDDNELISVESFVSGGVTISDADYFLRRADDKDEPPYQSIEIDLSSSAALSAGVTFQRSIGITGLWGYTDTRAVAAELGGNINDSVFTAVFNPVDGVYEVGVGSLVLIGTERMLTTARRMSDTGVNTASALDDSQADTTLAVTDGTNFATGEIILVDSERMRVDDIAGNNLVVSRAWDGTVLATHLSGVDVYALRTFTIERASVGSTAASHTAGDTVYVQRFPRLVTELNIAETVVQLEQNSAAYARVVGSGPNARESVGKGLEDIRSSAYVRYGRKLRSGAV